MSFAAPNYTNSVGQKGMHSEMKRMAATKASISSQPLIHRNAKALPPQRSMPSGQALLKRNPAKSTGPSLPLTRGPPMDMNTRKLTTKGYLRNGKDIICTINFNFSAPISSVDFFKERIYSYLGCVGV